MYGGERFRNKTLVLWFRRSSGPSTQISKIWLTPIEFSAVTRNFELDNGHESTKLAYNDVFRNADSSDADTRESAGVQ